MEPLKIMDPQPLIVGEGPVWDAVNRILYTFDIRGKCVRSFDWDSQEHAQRNYAQEIGCIALTEQGSLLLAMEDGVYLEENPGKLRLIGRPEHMLGRRFNDGKAGPDNRFYVGTKSEEGNGAFYRMDHDGTMTMLFDQVTNSNGLAWNLTGDTLYYIDSSRHLVEAFDFDCISGTVSNRRTIVENPCKPGELDGMTIDSQGMLWVAVWGGSCLLRIDPIAQKVLHKISFPVKQPTCCTFAGEELRDLVITTAAFQQTEDVHAGKTYRLETQVAGLPGFRFHWEGE